MQPKRVAVLRGGPSAEYDISMLTGAGVLAALAARGYHTKDVVIDRAGEWLVEGFIREPEAVLVDVDVVFLALHGAYGEDGTVQRIFDRIKIPYTGSGPYASRIAMNKHLAKEHLKTLGFKLPKHLRVTRDGVSDVMKTALSINELFGPRYVLKPLSGGSSIDTHMVNGVGSLAMMIGDMLSEYDEIMVEERISGKEATVGVLEGFRGSQYYILPEIEIVPPPDREFFAADVKYTGATEEIVPGRFSKDEKLALRQAAQAIHQTLNLQQISRSDFIVNPSGIYFLEVNTLPGLTAESLLPRAMTAVGSTYEELIEHLVKTARV